jgi:hypothetical protein
MFALTSLWGSWYVIESLSAGSVLRWPAMQSTFASFDERYSRPKAAAIPSKTAVDCDDSGAGFLARFQGKIIAFLTHTDMPPI